MENNIQIQQQLSKAKVYHSECTLSIRRKDKKGLPGDDSTLHNMKIGSSLQAGGEPLRGLSFDEEQIYLPSIIGTDPRDLQWRTKANNYWSNISVPIPSDGLNTNPDILPGKILKFTVRFEEEKDKIAFEETLDLTIKANIVSTKGLVVDGISDYILFRYCLVYGRVANTKKDIFKSPKIRFYLYSKQGETKRKHNAMKLRAKAKSKFVELLDPQHSKIVDAILLMFGENLAKYPELDDKHLRLEALSESRPDEFLKVIDDSDLATKALITKAVSLNIINNPSNTDSYYFGDNNAVTIGHTIQEAVLFFKSTDEKKVQIVNTIKAQIKQFN